MLGILLTKKELYTLYIVKGLSQAEIGKLYNVSPKNINYYVRKYNLKGIKGKIKYPINESKISISDPVFCYLAGLVATDGHIDYPNNRITIRVNNKGSEVTLQNILDYYECMNTVAHYDTGNEMRMTSKVLIKELDKLNVRGTHKTYSLTFPKSFHSMECYAMYLRGMSDGDGNIHVKKSKVTDRYCGGQFRIVLASEPFITELISSLNSNLGTRCKLSYHSTTGIKYPNIEMSVKDNMTFYEFIYRGFDDFKFQDKYTKYLLLQGEDIV